MNPISRVAQSFWKSPVVWGFVATASFYALVHAGVFGSGLVVRLFASHPVEYVETSLFFVGMAALCLILAETLGQFRRLGENLLGPIPGGGQPVGDAAVLLDRLKRLPAERQGDILVRRLREALTHVARRRSAERFEEHLHHLADLDAERQHAAFALVRVIIWAIPILGFLGTVIGITLAIAQLSPEALEQSLPEVTAGLGVAFDTTALALGLSMILMFAQFFTTRVTARLLERVDQRAEEELVGRFEQAAAGDDGQIRAVRRMADAVVAMGEDLVRRQAELWQATMEASQQRFARLAETAGTQLHSALAGALEKSLKAHAQAVSAAEAEAADANRKHWDQVQRSLAAGTEGVVGLQAELASQAEVLGRAVEATGQVMRLEEALNRNLAALAGAAHFEQTVNSLAAAIHLLTGKLGQLPGEPPRVHLEPPRKTGQAA